jgi:hypothetical protein
MNYFAHGRAFLHDPYFLAGTALPDWLNVVDRRVRARSKSAQQLIQHSDPIVVSLALGVIQHHADDRWFHQTRAFAELSLQLTLAVRERLPHDEGFRPSFLGHILVELILDASLIEDEPSKLDLYYSALQGVDGAEVARAVRLLTGKEIPDFSRWIDRFLAERFLYDYLDDAKLLTRLNHVMRRVGLAYLPDELGQLFPAARQAVRERRSELLLGQQDAAKAVAARSPTPLPKVLLGQEPV